MDLSRANVVVVVFVMEGCPACHEYLPRFRQVAAKYPQVPTLILDANAERNQPLADRLGVEGTPSTYIMRRGPGVATAEGAIGDAEIEHLMRLADHYAR